MVKLNDNVANDVGKLENPMQLHNNEKHEDDNVEGRKVIKGGLGKKRTWKPSGERFSRHLHNFVNEDKKLSWNKRKEQKQVAKIAKEIELEMKNKKVEEKRALKERRSQNAKKRTENEIRSSTFQVIKNTSRIKNWKSKAKQKLLKMSPEMIQQMYGGRN